MAFPALTCRLVSLEWVNYGLSLDDLRAILAASRSTIRSINLGKLSQCNNDRLPRVALIDFHFELPLTSLTLGEDREHDGVDPLYLDALPARLPLLRHLSFTDGKGYSNSLFDTLSSTNPLLRTISLYFTDVGWPAALPSLLSFIRTRGGAGNLEVLKFTTTMLVMDNETFGPRPKNAEIDEIVRAAGEAGVGLELPRWGKTEEWMEVEQERNGARWEKEEEEEEEEAGDRQEGRVMRDFLRTRREMGRSRYWRIALGEVKYDVDDYW